MSLRPIIAGIIALCLTYPAFASDPNRLLSKYVHTVWGLENGFPGGSTSSIAQTSDGYLWIGTDKGLIRFDGFSFRKFEQAVPNAFPIGPVKSLLPDDQGNLWILLQDTKLLRYRDLRFELVRGAAENGITAICRSATGGVLVSSLARGTLAFDGKQFDAISAGPAYADPVARANGVAPDERSTNLSWSTGVTSHLLAAPTSAVISMATTSDGKTWLGTEDKGLFVLSGDRKTAAWSGLPGEKITSLLALQGPELWIGTSKGVLHWTGNEFTRADVPIALQNVEILSMIRDRDLNIWVGTEHGLLRYSSRGVSNRPERVSTNSSPVRALFEDREHNLWIGGPRVLERLRESAFVTFSTRDGLPSDRNGPVFVDAESRTWFAPLDGGLYWTKGTQDGSVTEAGVGQDVVYSISARGNELWIGRQHGGLTVLRRGRSSFAAKTYTEADGLAQNSVYAVYESQDGSVWAGTLSRGVSKLKDGHFTNYTTTDGLASNTVSSIAEGTDGTMWFGTPAGLSEFSKNEWRSYAFRDGLSTDISCLLWDSGGALWIGAAGGLAFLHNGRVQTPQGTQAWLREPILGMAEDNQGWLWMATSTLVLRAKRDSLLNGRALNDSDFRVYGRDDGLAGTEAVKRFRSVVKDSQGNVWFSTNHGLTVVNPDRSTVNSLPALLRVESVTVDGSDMNLGQAILVPPGQQKIVFQYLGLSLAKPERVRYRYWLDGFDRGWSEATTNREAAFANLTPGKYRFRVICSNSDGIWNNGDAAIDFSVLPAFYQTNWFRMLCVTTFLAFLWGVYQLRVQQLRRQFTVALDARVNERTRIARELHDTLLQSLHGLMFRFQAARNMFARRPEEALEALDGAIKRTEQAIAESREAIKNLRIEHSTSTDLDELLSAAGQELETSVDGNANRPTFQLIVAGERQDLSSGIQDEVYRIGRELLRNAFQHAHAHHIEAEIHYETNSLTLLVRDDGKGIDPTVIKEGGRSGHWGLPGVRERAKQIQAHLDFWTENRAGTEVQLRVPGSVAYKAVADKLRFRLFRGEKVS